MKEAKEKADRLAKEEEAKKAESAPNTDGGKTCKAAAAPTLTLPVVGSVLQWTGPSEVTYFVNRQKYGVNKAEVIATVKTSPLTYTITSKMLG